MRRWDDATNTSVEDVEVDNFLHDICEVYRKHRMVLSHEDCHGSFKVVKQPEDYSLYVNWLSNAGIGKDE